MFTKLDNETLSQKISEFKSLLIAYAKQEIQFPLKALLKWVLLGLLGSVFIIIGVLLVALGLLRLLQDQIPLFDNGLSFVPYCITALALIVIASVLFKSAKKHS